MNCTKYKNDIGSNISNNINNIIDSYKSFNTYKLTLKNNEKLLTLVNSYHKLSISQLKIKKIKLINYE